MRAYSPFSLAVAVLLGVAFGCGTRTAPKPGSGYTIGPSSELQIDLSEATPQAQEPNSIGLFFCLDTSGSMDGMLGGRRKLDISKQAMQKVFAQIADYVQKHPKKRVYVGLCSFAGKPKLLQGLRPFDQHKLQQAIEPLEAKGSTAIGDAIALGLKALANSGVETRAILVMTDGENKEGTAPDRVVEAIKKNRNPQGVATADVEVFLVAFDVNAQVFDAVKQAGAAVKESRDQASLQSILNTLVEEVLLEKPR